MGVNRQCPKCGSTKTKLSTAHDKQRHGFLWWIFIGWWWWAINWAVGFCIFCGLDWWMAIIAKSQGKGYIWKSAQWFNTTKKYYHCEECGHDFRG